MAQVTKTKSENRPTSPRVVRVKVVPKGTHRVERPAARAAARTVDIRVMSYNVECGRRWETARELIREHPADVICLQEVPQPGHRDFALHPAKVLEDFDLPHDSAMLWFRPPIRIGNMTLVRGRIQPGETLRVAPTEPYGFANVVEIHGLKLTVVNVHLSAMFGPPLLTFPITEIFRTREALDLSRRFHRHPHPVIALGDFNSFSPAPGYGVMNRTWRDCRRAAVERGAQTGGPRRFLATRPTYGLPFVIDHIFCRGPVEVTHYDVVDNGGSDHRAVLATLRVSCS